MMYLPNQVNEKLKIEADSKCFALTVVQSKSNSEFADLSQFSNWIDGQLELLEEQFAAFETKSSRQRYFQR